MAHPSGDAFGFRAPTIEDLREEFLAQAHAKNLSQRTIEWYERHTSGFRNWCGTRGIVLAADLRRQHLDAYIVTLQNAGASPHTVHGAAQVAKSIARFGFRHGSIASDISRDFQLPKLPQMIIATFTDDQIRDLLRAIDQRRWTGIRDTAIFILLLDTFARVSEITGLNLEDVNLNERTIVVMGKGRRQRELPFGRVAWQALGRYLRSVEEHRPCDPLFISRTGRRLTREGIAAAMRAYARRAQIRGVRASPHTLRHTGAKRFILGGGDVFSLQKMLGHRSLAMVRRYVELADNDVRFQHDLYSPADAVLRRPHPGRT